MLRLALCFAALAAGCPGRTVVDTNPAARTPTGEGEGEGEGEGSRHEPEQGCRMTIEILQPQVCPSP